MEHISSYHREIKKVFSQVTGQKVVGLPGARKVCRKRQTHVYSAGTCRVWREYGVR